MGYRKEIYDRALVAIQKGKLPQSVLPKNIRNHSMQPVPEQSKSNERSHPLQPRPLSPSFVAQTQHKR